MGWLGTVKSIFGFDGIGDTTLKIVDKIAGTDWTPQQKADFILKHAEVTKYQSPIRRFIATVYVLAWVTLVLTWLVSSIMGRAFDFGGCIALASDIFSFLDSNVNMAMNGILAFYFLMNMRK